MAEKKKNLKLDINLQVFSINFDTLKKLAIHNFMKERFSDGGGSFFDKICTPALKTKLRFLMIVCLKQNKTKQNKTEQNH